MSDEREEDEEGSDEERRVRERRVSQRGPVVHLFGTLNGHACVFARSAVHLSVSPGMCTHAKGRACEYARVRACVRVRAFRRARMASSSGKMGDARKEIEAREGERQR